jgi:hypothetical protein
VVLADGGVQRLEVGVVHGLDLAGQHVALEHPLHREALAFEFGSQLFATVLDHVVAPLAREPLLDLVASPGRGDEVEPVAGGPGALHLGGEDLAGVTAVQLVVERHQPAVDPCADAGVAHLGVHGVGEVDRGGLAGAA